MDINIAEEKEIGKKWCKEGEKNPNLEMHADLYWNAAGKCKVDTEALCPSVYLCDSALTNINP